MSVERGMHFTYERGIRLVTVQFDYTGYFDSLISRRESVFLSFVGLVLFTFQNNTNHPMSSNSHPLATANNAGHLLKMAVVLVLGVFYNKKTEEGTEEFREVKNRCYSSAISEKFSSSEIYTYNFEKKNPIRPSLSRQGRNHHRQILRQA